MQEETTLPENNHNIEALKTELENAQKKADENFDKALRALAELENIKRRAERDIENAHKYALDSFVENLIPVIDSLEQALASIEQHLDESTIKQGIMLTLKMFLDTLAKFKVNQINPVAQNFDPNLHEAMSMIENNELQSNTVITVLQKGYTLNGRLIRPARVIVVK